MELSLRIGGAAGDGVASTGEIIARTCSRSGLHVLAMNGYQSVIRGGHTWYHIRAGSGPVPSAGDGADLLVALNQQTADVHAPELRTGGGLIFDPSIVRPAAGHAHYPIPLAETAVKFSPLPIMRNTVAAGCAARLLGLDFETLASVLDTLFGDKGGKVVAANTGAARAGYDFASEKWGGACRRPVGRAGPGRYLMTGNQAIAVGALAAGCRFLAQYPMTPATGILHYLVEKGPKYGMVVKQVEDELAAINMAIGAAHAGARAMTATSGGGFSLMVEGLGLAGMTETPVVIVDSQRGGPSTGLPTMTEQGDLNMVLGASQGDFPRAVLAPRDVGECYRLTTLAFNLADRYQTPVILLSDFYLSEMMATVEQFDLNPPIERGPIFDDSAIENPKSKIQNPKSDFRRYLITPSGVSPRAFPGTPGTVFTAGSDEHDEGGGLVSDVRAGLPESLKTRKAMHEKRMRKLDGLRREMPGPELHGPAGADLTVISWGSTSPAVREAVERLHGNGASVNSLEFFALFPLPAPAVDALKRCKRTVMVEANITGQFAGLLRRETGHNVDTLITKYDGNPFYPGELVSRIGEVKRNG